MLEMLIVVLGFIIKTLATGFFLIIGIEGGKELITMYRNWRTNNKPEYVPPIPVSQSI